MTILTLIIIEYNYANSNSVSIAKSFRSELETASKRTLKVVFFLGLLYLVSFFLDFVNVGVFDSHPQKERGKMPLSCVK